VQAAETPRQIVPLETTEPAPISEAPPVVREAEAPATPALSAEAVPNSPPEPTVVSSPVVEETRTAVREFTARPMTATKADYGWLAEALWSRVEQLKRYPHLARMNRWEGRVVLRVVIQEDGHLLDLAVSESSGHSVLDQDALEVLKLASPLTLKHPLGKPQVVVQVPISYRLER
jgi:protein TonB